MAVFFSPEKTTKIYQTIQACKPADRLAAKAVLKRVKVTTLGLISALLALPAIAQASVGLEPFPLADVEMSKSDKLVEHRIATGRIQKKNSESMPEYWLTLPGGELNRTLYRVHSSRGTDDIYQHYKQQLKQPGIKVLFECSARDCGSSIHWANQVFNVSTLYGIDRKQHYLAVERKHNGLSEFISLYITERGTGRTYVYEEHYRLPSDQVSQGDSRNLFEQLGLSGWTALPVSADGSFEEGAFEQLQQLVQDLNESAQKYWLVAHRYGVGSDQELIERSEQSGQRLLQALEKMGLKAEKISIRALGPLAPTTNSINYGGRIELIQKDFGSRIDVGR